MEVFSICPRIISYYPSVEEVEALFVFEGVCVVYQLSIFEVLEHASKDKQEAHEFG